MRRLDRLQKWLHRNLWTHAIRSYTTYEGAGKYVRYEYCQCGRIWLSED